MKDFNTLVSEITSCTICEETLPHGVRPVFQLHPEAKILIAGQAPGRKVHESGIPFDDASGERLRDWLGIDATTFYDSKKIAILPMGFCYPGTGKSGDLPPRPECVEAWHDKILEHLSHIELTIVLGKYAQDFYFDENKITLTALVQSWEKYWPNKLPLPHPSPRNNIWLKKNQWFENEILPTLKKRVHTLLS